MRHVLVFAAGLAACQTSVTGDPDEEDDRPPGYDVQGALDGDQPELCNQLIEQRGQMGREHVVDGVTYQVLQGTDGDDVLVGDTTPDLVFGGAGDDKIDALGGNDIVCAGAGRDHVDGGLGQDRIFGGAGNDILHGGGHGDWIHGEGDDDEVYGDLLDDKLFGDDGSDLLVGAHGTDLMHGGPGADWLRGDTNGDDFIGGEGEDTVSFITARPSGRAGRTPPFVMDVDLPGEVAMGDGAGELMQGIERVIGSPFDDQLRGGGELIGDLGNDTCNGTPCGDGAVELPYVGLDPRPRDTGVVVLGGPADDHMVFARVDFAVVVTETTGAPLHAGTACEQTAVDVVTCRPSDPLRYLVAWGGEGNDELTIQPGFPRDFNAHLDGGPGDDALTGADGQDLLFAGRSGNDTLDGNGGDDALISESYFDDRDGAGATHGGGDLLLGRGGNDQLVCDDPCAGHFYSGGPGVDIAGFARVGERDIHAQMGGQVSAANRSDFHGRSFLPGSCGVGSATSIEPDLEILEGSKGNDILLGDDDDDTIWGRQGNDTLAGFGGRDVLLGSDGNDEVFGGDGEDVESP